MRFDDSHSTRLGSWRSASTPGRAVRFDGYGPADDASPPQGSRAQFLGQEFETEEGRKGWRAAGRTGRRRGLRERRCFGRGVREALAEGIPENEVEMAQVKGEHRWRSVSWKRAQGDEAEDGPVQRRRRGSRTTACRCRERGCPTCSIRSVRERVSDERKTSRKARRPTA